MSESLDTLIEYISKHCRTGVIHNVAQYVFNHKGDNLNTVAEAYVNNGFSQPNMTKFVQKVQDAVGWLISDNKVDGLVARSRQEIIQMAEARKIPLKSYLKYSDAPLPPSHWFGKALNLDGVDKVERVKQCLRWINCLTEFYCGEALLEEKYQYSPTLDNSSAVNSQNLENPKTTLNDLRKMKQEEEFFYKLWEQGYLKCDLSN